MRIGTWNVLMFVTYEQLKRVTKSDDCEPVQTTHIVIAASPRKSKNSNNNNNNNMFDLNLDVEDWSLWPLHNKFLYP